MKKIAAIITAIIVTACLAFSISAETLTPEAIESLKDEYENAKVVLDLYCLGLYNGSTYELTEAYRSLDLSAYDLTDPNDLDALAQEAFMVTFAEGSAAVPAIEAAKLDVTIKDLPIGLYLLLAHGSDLTHEEYCKTIKSDDGTEKQVTIAKTDTYEYRFSPILLAMDYKTADAVVQVKAEQADRFGRLRIHKKVTAYSASHPATFVFQVEGKDADGEIVFRDVAGLTLDGTEEGYVDVEHIPVGLTVTVTEIYDGSDLTKVSGPDPESVVIEPDEITSVTIGTADDAAGGDTSGDAAGDDASDAPKQNVTFVNTYDYQENHGFGITNRFRYNGSTWEWFKDGVLQEAGTGDPS